MNRIARAWAELTGRAVARNYEAARPAPRRDLGRFPAGINGAVAAASGSLRSRARYQAVNNPLVRNGVDAWATFTLGADGPRPTGVGPRATRRWAAWSRANGFPAMLGTAFRDVIVAGESLIVLNGDVPNLLPAEQLSDESDGRNLISGVRVDDFGRPVAYEIHPGLPESGDYRAPIRVDADDVLHLFRVDTAGQQRGATWIAASILPAAGLVAATDAMTERARLAASLVGAIVSEANGETPLAEALQVENLGPASLVTMAPGERIEWFNVLAGTDNVVLLKERVREIAAGMGLPPHLVDGDLSQANYSSLRAGLLPFYSQVETVRHTMLTPALDKLWTRVTGAEAPAEWLWPALPTVDQAKQLAAEERELALGLTSRRRLAASRGWSLEDLDAELAAEGWTAPAKKETR